MNSPVIHLVDLITTADPALRNRSLDEWCAPLSYAQLREEAVLLEAFRRRSDNLYERVRAIFFLAALHRFHFPTRPELPVVGRIPFSAYQHLLDRRFSEAIDVLLGAERTAGPNAALASALAAAYHQLAFQTLGDQVRRSVRSVRGNQWMFRIGHPADQPLRLQPQLLQRSPLGGFPVLAEATPVRMDLTHSAWSDIFFLGMDYPEGARVLNISIDLAVRRAGPDEDKQQGSALAGTQMPAEPQPPVQAFLRVIDEPVLRLVSVDLATVADIRHLDEIFDFGRDYLGLLKAALIASGVVPPGLEGSEEQLGDLLERLVGPGQGVELISNVNGIPKGSRLAVSTNLLAALIAVCMRATGQTRSLEGPLEERERRLIAARAILGEWLAGSGGGWQDSGGVWPGIKLIQGQEAVPGDVEWGVSRGRLLPAHRILDESEVAAATRQALQDSLVLVHGGMAQNVGPILEMVTEKYLVRSAREWQARLEAGGVLDDILAALAAGDIPAIGDATTRNFFGPLQTIVPWASNLYTETLIQEVRAEFGADFWGFWMLGGMSGGGMGFIFHPARKAEAQGRLQTIMSDARRRFEHALPFAMEPVVYEFAINERGSWARRFATEDTALPGGYYAILVPRLMRLDPRWLTIAQRAELDAFGAACRARPQLSGMVQVLFDRLLPRSEPSAADVGTDRRETPVAGREGGLRALLEASGFDAMQHEHIRSELRQGRIGLAQNRLPVTTEVRDVDADDVFDGLTGVSPEMQQRGAAALAAGQVAVVTLAAGAGSRWTQGAGVVKALHPFAKLSGRHRTFLEIHLAKSRRSAAMSGRAAPHLFTTSYLTHHPIAAYLDDRDNCDYAGPVVLSPGCSIGLRLVPTVRDLTFAWEETAQQLLDEQAQKMRLSTQAALLGWVRGAGEASDYTDNVPSQCLHPVGHWYEIPNLLRNGTLAHLLDEQPQLQYLLLHNIDTLGANLDPGLLGLHISRGAALSIEVIPRRLEDRGGGPARVNGRLRLVEGLALPREEDEFQLTYYNSLTTWITIDALLAAFGLTRDTLADAELVQAAIRRVAARIPTYITLKDVKRRWGYGHEDVFPVAQFEKIWGDMTTLPELDCRYVAVERMRGQQLKEQAQLDGWLRDGSAAFVESLCLWP